MAHSFYFYVEKGKNNIVNFLNSWVLSFDIRKMHVMLCCALILHVCYSNIKRYDYGTRIVAIPAKSNLPF